MISTLWQDLRYGVRTLARSPGFTIVAVLTLALGIGANSAMFSLVNAVLLRPLPFADPERIVILHEKRGEEKQGSVGGHEFVAWQQRSRVFEHMALFGYRAPNLTGVGDPRVLDALVTTADYFAVLGLNPQLGRGFQAGDDRATGARVAVLSDQLWREGFQADASIVGRAIRLDDVPFTVVGVMPARGDFDPDIWLPLDIDDEAQKVGKHSFFVLARLKANATIAQADQDLEAIALQLESEYPGFNVGHRVSVRSMYDNTVQSARRPVWILLGAVAFVLLIACANVAHLLLTRAMSREREIAIRAALGAGRGRLITQLLTESLVLAAMGGIVGLVLASWIVDLLPKIKAVEIPRLAEVGIDGRVLAVTATLTILTGLISGLLPAFKGSKLHLSQWLAAGKRASSSVTGRAAGFLMTSQIALALVLLIGTGLMVRSFVQLIGVDPGFRDDGVVTMQIALPAARFSAPVQQTQAVDELTERIRALPGVRSVGTTTQLPMTFCCNGYALTLEGRPARAPGEELSANLGVTSPDYFRAMGIPLRSGRAFSASDARAATPLIRYWEQQPNPPRFNEPQAAPVVIVNQTMARRYWPNEDPVGKRFRVLFSPWITVVGVVGDVRHTGLNAEFIAEMYLPQSQEPRREMMLVVKTANRDPLSVVPAVREQIRALDRDIPIEQVRTMENVVEASVGRPRFYAQLLGLFGALALMLSGVGIYGVISYAVAQRTHELGIRTALGAQMSDVLRLVLGQALGLTFTGIGIGLVAAFALTRLLRNLLFGVAPTDPLTFVVIAFVLTSASLLASYVPTRRALRVDPMTSLRKP